MDEELVYKQNMSRNEAMKILKAITIPSGRFCPGLVYHQSFWSIRQETCLSIIRVYVDHWCSGRISNAFTEK